MDYKIFHLSGYIDMEAVKLKVSRKCVSEVARTLSSHQWSPDTEQEMTFSARTLPAKVRALVHHKFLPPNLQLRKIGK